MAANGYPGDYAKGSVISGFEKAAAIPGIKIFHAGTQKKDGKVTANSGRVLGVTALAADFSLARKAAYEAVNALDWPEGFCRKDIAERVA
jgi:phosphoribosylamine--glycine ligase